MCSRRHNSDCVSAPWCRNPGPLSAPLLRGSEWYSPDWECIRVYCHQSKLLWHLVMCSNSSHFGMLRERAMRKLGKMKVNMWNIEEWLQRCSWVGWLHKNCFFFKKFWLKIIIKSESLLTYYWINKALKLQKYYNKKLYRIYNVSYPYILFTSLHQIIFLFEEIM